MSRVYKQIINDLEFRERVLIYGEIKAANIPPNKQFCLLFKIINKIINPIIILANS